MALWYRRPNPTPVPSPVPGAAPMAPTVHPFRAWTESLFITGSAYGDDRLSDILNRREPMRVANASVVPIGAPRAAMYSQTELLLDPFDFDIVLGQAMDSASADMRAARRIHKVRYPVLIDCHTFEVRGTIHLFPGNEPEFAVQRTGPLFLAVTSPVVRRERRVVSDPMTDVALVNRYAVSRIRQIDSPLH